MDISLRFCGILSILQTLIVRENLATDVKVPVLMWSDDESLVFPDTFVGHSVSQNQFKNLYLDKLLVEKDIKTLVVFVQDQLTVGEISLNADVYGIGKGGAYKHTMDVLSGFHSAFLPRVASPASVLTELKDSFPGKTFTLKPPYDLSALNLEFSKKNLVIVHLPSEHGTSADVNGYLRSVDDIIYNVTLQLQGQTQHFAVLYTGKKAHEQTSLEQHSGRHLLQDSKQNDTENGLVLGIPGLFLIHSSQVSFVYNYGANSTDLSTIETDWNVTSGYDCPPPGFNGTSMSNLTCTLKLRHNIPIDVDDYQLHDFSLDMVFATTSESQSGYWYLKTFSMSYKNGSTSDSGNLATIGLDEKFVDWTPFGFSYHCHENPPIRPKLNESEFAPESVYLTFKAFQVQVFDVKNGFGYYNDCVGFFSIPIWSAIICCAILIAILFFGVIMLMDIKTMDRLDDPKGKTITVTASD